MKTINVSAAVIIRKNPLTQKSEVLATQRGYGDYKDWWEFPGGKIESLESPEDCIVREIREELASDIKPEKIIDVIDYDYPEFHLTMHCILCTPLSSTLELREHENSLWLTKETLRSVKWLPADYLVLNKIEKLL
ncbi:(deoxy)nucleoside triphosphate pyrophosphohydrolase [Treponema sp.]|uniref:(deoxy)nucleoside triphosphate pyrophosphohydrolase n=1 Tax=Treponema sp. TaxID=166 RepID=UPI003890763D